MGTPSDPGHINDIVNLNTNVRVQIPFTTLRIGSMALA